MHYIYMNEHIEKKGNEEPVICVTESGSDRFVYTNKVDIVDFEGNIVAAVVYSREGLQDDAVKHDVSAWVEVYDSRLKVFNE